MCSPRAKRRSSDAHAASRGILLQAQPQEPDEGEMPPFSCFNWPRLKVSAGVEDSSSISPGWFTDSNLTLLKGGLYSRIVAETKTLERFFNDLNTQR